jgi:(p)ppGpp synthase/HD superfamily hydrolase
VDRASTLASARLEQALRMAATGHEGQFRRSSRVPYVEHVVAVAWILDRAGFDEDVVIAGLLHDLLEDTPATRDQVEASFGSHVADLIAVCSEEKLDAQGQKRPWIDRKRDHLAALAQAQGEARAIVLADKLHNLISIELDLKENRPVWSEFNAQRDQVLGYQDAMISVCAATPGDPRIERLADACREVLARTKALGR